MNNDSKLFKDIKERLDFEPGVDLSQISFAVHDRIATFNGSVASAAEKRLIKRVVSRLEGIRAIADEILVKPYASALPSDNQVAAALIQVLDSDVSLPKDKIKLTVEQGKVTLLGEVSWHYQRLNAERDIACVAGVVAIHNLLEVNPFLASESQQALKEKISQAFERYGLFDTQSIMVELSGTTLTLSGTVRSWAEFNEAEHIARSIPGVAGVDNRIQINSGAKIDI